jgi:tetratricopeptide (TPR) repeat protein
MTRRGKGAALAAAAAMLVASRPGSGAPPAQDAVVDPFIHQFLIPGDPFDERLLAQEKRVEEDPNSPALRNDLGNLLAERRFAEQARDQYETASKLDKTFFLAAYNLGMLEESEGRVSAAISAYKEAIKRRRGFPAAHFRLGRVYEKHGHPDDAIAEYAKALRIDAAMLDPRVNPLVIDSRLIARASLANYPRDVARAAERRGNGYVDVARFRPVPTDRPLDTGELAEEAGPQTIESSKTAPAAARPAARPPTNRPVRSRREAPRSPPPPQAAPQAPEPIPPELGEPVEAPPEPEPER